jgi:uncharacterized protein (TIGR02231 family)
MKTARFFVLLLASLPVLHAADAPDADTAQPLVSRITDVVVYADRAQVTRRTDLDLGKEGGRYAFARLPGWLDEGSVRVSLVPAEAGQVLDVQIHRTYLAKASDEEFRKAEVAVRDISDQIGTLDDEKAVLESQAKQVEAIRAFSLDKVPKDTAVREIKPAEYGESVKFVTTSLREIAVARRELEKKRRDLQPELAARQRKLEDLRQRSQLEQRTVVVTLKGGGKASLNLSYMLPGATWEPVHELRASPDGRTVALASYAVIMQTTGEDWTGVNLSLSTQRSTETMKIPELEALLVGTGRKIARVAASSRDSFQAANKNFEAQNGFWFALNNDSTVLQQEYRSNQAVLFSNVKRVEQVFETLRERGTTAHFQALGALTVRSDGRPIRAPIGSAELAAQHRLLAAPELSLNAAHTVDLTNTARQAVLPGKVSLYLDGAFLGLTETDFVAPGESFALYLGVANQIKLGRTLDRKRSELKRSGQRTKVQASFLVTVENLSDRPAVVQLADRIPVSENEEVRVSGVKVSPDGKPDAKGLLRWDLTLAPKQSREFRVEYSLEYPTDLPARKVTGGEDAQAAPAARLHEQIMGLEMKLK